MAVTGRGKKTLTAIANDLLLQKLSSANKKDYEDNPLQLLTLAAKMRGYDYEELNPLIEKKVYKKSIYDRMTIDQCMQMLNRGLRLEIKPNLLEKLEIYIHTRIFEAENDPDTPSRFNENRIDYYLHTFQMRRRLSLVQIQSVIKFIDHFFDKATQKGTNVRKNLRRTLGFVDSQIKADFIGERKAIIGFLKRDPTLTEDEITESLEAERSQMELQKQIQSHFAEAKRDEEMDEAIRQYEEEIKKIEEEIDEAQRQKEQARK